MNEYETHLSSYDHSHKQRLRDLRQLTRDPMASEKARKAEAKANSQSGLISIKFGGEGSTSGAPTGFKKAGFKKAGFKSSFAPVSAFEGSAVVEESQETRDAPVVMRGETTEGVESDTEDDGYEMYDPRYPTD